MVLQNDATIDDSHYFEAYQSALQIMKCTDRSGRFPYHCVRHMEENVLPSAIDIAIEEGMELEDIVVAAVAAAFHDTGLVSGEYAGHEMRSIALAEGYMRTSKLPYSEGHINAVGLAILSTDLTTKPLTPIGKVLRDADVSYIGTDDYAEQSRLLRKEWNNMPGHPYGGIDDKSWRALQINFLESHRWYTDAARKLYDEKKQENLAELKTRDSR